MRLINALKTGDIPERVRAAAAAESVETDTLIDDIIAGRTVIPANSGRTGISPVAIGRRLKTKVNANIGTSSAYTDLDEELKKLDIAVNAGADTVMDLSTGGDIGAIRLAVLAASTVPVGSVPIYQAAARAIEVRGSVVDMSADDMFEAVEQQCRDGVDFITVHCGVTQRSIEALQRQGRVTDVVSRGGAFLTGWVLHNGRENPLYEDFDRLLEIARRYDVTLSLGDGMRPGCGADASDAAQLEELIVLGELVKRSRAAEVQAIVEGPGHVPIDQIEANMALEKRLCDGAPFYVLGPLVTDVAPGYDEITAAIGGALAAVHGADFLCYVTPREHLGLPTLEDVKRGVIASRIAAHAADVAKGIPGAADWDRRMSEARKALDWPAQIELSIDPERARASYDERRGEGLDACTMCGEFCAMKVVADYLESPSTEACG